MKRKWLVLAVALCLVAAMALSACSGGGGSGSTPPAATPPASGSSDTAAPAATDEEFNTIELVYASHLPEDNPSQKNITMLQEKLDEKMGPGVITLTTYAAGTLSKQDGMLDAVLDGTCDFAYLQLSVYPGRLPVLQLLDYPGVIYTGTTAASYTLRDFINESNLPEWEGLYAMWPMGFGQGAIFSNKDINSLADMKGLQIRCGSTAAPVVEAWGATPVTMDQSEVYEAARNGLINGMVNGVGMAGGYHTDEIFSNITVIPFYNQSYVVAANEKIFDRMTPKQAELFKEATNEVFEEYSSIYMGNIDNDTAAQEAIRKTKSFVFMSNTPGEVEEFYAPLDGLTGKYVQQLNEQGLDGDGNLARLQTIADKYNAQFPNDDRAQDLYLKFRD